MNLIGIPYLTDALTAAINARRRVELYQGYVADRLYTLCSFVGAQPSHRYIEMLHPIPDDPRSGMEIAVDRLTAMGLTVID